MKASSEEQIGSECQVLVAGRAVSPAHEFQMQMLEPKPGCCCIYCSVEGGGGGWRLG